MEGEVIEDSVSDFLLLSTQCIKLLKKQWLVMFLMPAIVKTINEVPHA